MSNNRPYLSRNEPVTDHQTGIEIDYVPIIAKVPFGGFAKGNTYSPDLVVPIKTGKKHKNKGCVLASFGELLVSESVLDALIQLTNNNVQIFPTVHLNKKGEYFVVSPKRLVECIDFRLTKHVEMPGQKGVYIINPKECILRQDAVGKNQVFVTQGWAPIILGEKVKTLLESLKGKCGLSFEELKTI